MILQVISETILRYNILITDKIIDIIISATICFKTKVHNTGQYMILFEYVSTKIELNK